MRYAFNGKYLYLQAKNISGFLRYNLEFLKYLIHVKIHLL